MARGSRSTPLAGDWRPPTTLGRSSSGTPKRPQPIGAALRSRTRFVSAADALQRRRPPSPRQRPRRHDVDQRPDRRLAPHRMQPRHGRALLRRASSVARIDRDAGVVLLMRPSLAPGGQHNHWLAVAVPIALSTLAGCGGGDRFELTLRARDAVGSREDPQCSLRGPVRSPRRSHCRRTSARACSTSGEHSGGRRMAGGRSIKLETCSGSAPNRSRTTSSAAVRRSCTRAYGTQRRCRLATSHSS